MNLHLVMERKHSRVMKTDASLIHHFCPQASSRFARLGDVNLHYVELGKGPIVLLVHGFPEFWYSFHKQMKPLAEAGFRVVALDTRGYNLSSKPQNIAEYTGSKLAEDLARLVSHLGELKVNVVAHDWGATIAWFFAMNYPSRLEKLVTINGPHPADFGTQIKKPEQFLRSLYMLFFQLPRFPECLLSGRGFKRLFYAIKKSATIEQAFTKNDFDIYQHVFRDVSSLRGPLHYYRAAFRGALASEKNQTPSVYRQVPSPTLVLWGKKDIFLSPSLARVNPNLAPNLKVIWFEEASHWVHRERADEVNSAIAKFLSDT